LLEGVSKGNYFLEMKNEDGKIMARHIFVNVEEAFFD
jgi:hypothetical protein